MQWLRFFIAANTNITRGILRDHVANWFATPGLIDKVRDSLPISSRVRLIYDLLVVELALEFGLSIDAAYIERASDVSSLIVKAKTDA